MWCLWVLVVGFALMCAFMGWACCAAAGMADDYAEEMRRRMLAEALLAKAERDEHDCFVEETILPNGELGCPVCSLDSQELEDEQNYQRTVGEGLGLIG